MRLRQCTPETRNRMLQHVAVGTKPNDFMSSLAPELLPASISSFTRALAEQSLQGPNSLNVIALQNLFKLNSRSILKFSSSRTSYARHFKTSSATSRSTFQPTQNLHRRCFLATCDVRLKATLCSALIDAHRSVDRCP